MKLSGNRDAALSAAAVATIVTTAVLLYRRNKNDKSSPPAVPVGMIGCIKAMADPEAFLPSMLDWARALDFPSVMNFPLPSTESNVLVCDPDLTWAILIDKSSSKPARIYSSTESVRGASLPTHVDDEKWKHARKGIAPAFSSKHVRRMNEVCEAHVERWVKDVLDPLAESGKAFDPSESLMELTVSVICDAAFNHEPSKQEIHGYLNNSDLLMDEVLKRYINPFRKIFPELFYSARVAKQAFREISAFCNMMLEKHRNSPNPTRGTVLDLLDKNPHYAHDAARLSDIDILVFAGFDTTAQTMSWIIYMMAEHPEEMKKVQESLRNTGESERSSCPALQNAIRESMRLHPVASFGVSRIAGRDFHTKDGYVVRKGTNCFLSQMLVHRNCKVFGNDANEFRPDRWNDADDKMKASFGPFSWGAHDCMGQRLAIAEINSVVSVLLTRYTIELVSDYTPTFNITHQPAGGRIKIKRVSS